jgi:hypothetical protein
MKKCREIAADADTTTGVPARMTDYLNRSKQRKQIEGTVQKFGQRAVNFAVCGTDERVGASFWFEHLKYVQAAEKRSVCKINREIACD